LLEIGSGKKKNLLIISTYPLSTTGGLPISVLFIPGHWAIPGYTVIMVSNALVTL